MYNQIYNLIWIPRCNDMNKLEKELGITKEMKRKYDILQKMNNDQNHINTYSAWEIWISLTIEQGGQWMDF